MKFKHIVFTLAALAAALFLPLLPGLGIPQGAIVVALFLCLLAVSRRQVSWRFRLLLLVASTASLAASAATNAAPVANAPANSSTSLNWINAVIPIAVPLVIAAAKFLVPNIPGWLCPILAPALGAVADLLLHYAGAPTMGPMIGALLGSAGVGIREIQDQVNQKLAPAQA